MGQDPRTNPSAPLQIASIDTLNRRNKPLAHLVVTDEAHRDASPTRRKLRALYPGAFRLGVTATPHRLDGKGLRKDFDEMFIVSSISELIAEGYLAAPKVFTVPPDLLPDLTKVRTLAGEYEAETLNRAVNRRALIGGLVEHWLRIARGLRTVCFAASIEHSKHIVAQFVEAGVAAVHLDQDVSNTEREAVLRRLEDGDVSVISCVNILAEGWDCPSCKCVIEARPTMSLNLYIQQTGRCMRPWENVTPLILDHAGNAMTHGLPQKEREWTLDGEVKTQGDKGKVPAKVCAVCLAVVPAGVHECPECGALFEHTPAVLEEMPGKLVEYQLPKAELQAEWERIVKFAERKGFPETWAKRVYEAKYGTAPL